MEQPIIIPIGRGCHTPLILTHLGLRRYSLPFDWVVSNLDQICNALEDKLEHMLLESELNQFLDGEMPTDQAYNTNRYGIRFVHIFDRKYPLRPQIPTIVSQGQRRAQRLLNFLNGSQPILFNLIDGNYGADPITQASYIRFREILKSQYPNLKYQVAYIRADPSPNPNQWNYPELKMFYGHYQILVPGRFLFTSTQIQNYSRIYESLGIIIPSKKINFHIEAGFDSLISHIPPDFNWQQYLRNYADLRFMNEQQARNHYAEYGQNEGRLYTPILPSDFNWQKYVQNYPDLHFMNQLQAQNHYIDYGLKEGRIYI